MTYDENLPLVIVHPKAVALGFDVRLREVLKGKANVLVTRDAPELEALVIPADEINHLLNYTMSSLLKYIADKGYENDDVLELEP